MKNVASKSNFALKTGTICVLMKKCIEKVAIILYTVVYLLCCFVAEERKSPPLRLILSSIFDFCFQDIDFRGHVVGIIIPKTVKLFEHSRYAVKKTQTRTRNHTKWIHFIKLSTSRVKI